MVDFNNETTIARPAADVEKISILQRRYELLEALEDYKKKQFQRVNSGLGIVRARLFTLFMQTQAMLERRDLKKKDKEKIYAVLKTSCLNTKSTEMDILNSIFTINKELDDMQLTRVDNQKTYDSSNIEIENMEKGY